MSQPTQVFNSTGIVNSQQGNNNTTNNNGNSQNSMGARATNSIVDNKGAYQPQTSSINQTGDKSSASVNNGVTERFKDQEVIPLEVVKEKITYAENTLLPISFLTKGLAVQRAVCRVVDKTRGPIGTGFLFQDGYVMTNEHVVETGLQDLVFEFNYDSEEDTPIKCLPSRDEKRHFVSKEFDFAVVRLKSMEELKGITPLEIATADPEEAQRCNIIGHPKGSPKRVSLQKNVILKVSKGTSTIRYTTDTKSGSSGSPVFNNKWEVIALHHASCEYKDEKGKRVYLSNEGILISKIVGLADEWKKSKNKDKH